MSWLKQQWFVLPALLASVVVGVSLLSWSSRAAATEQYLPGSQAISVAGPQSTVVPNTPVSPEQADAVATIPSPSLQEITPTPPQTPPPAPAAPVADHAGVLNSARQFALGMIETGNNDRAIGGLGEVSRFQIMPSVWKEYSPSRSYRDLDVASDVASRHWTALHEYFKKKTNREPSDFDMYVLWNTRYGYYANREFSPAKLHPVVSDRAQRFANLVEDSSRRSSQLALAVAR